MVFLIILLLGLPYIGLYFGLNFGVFAKFANHNEFTSAIVESQIRGYFRQTLLQWSGFSLAAVTVLLAFTQYKLTQDKIALIIGLSILFSGSVEALHTLAVDGLSINAYEKDNLDALIWVFSNSMSGLILIVGFSFLLIDREKKTLKAPTLTLLTVLAVLTAITLIYYAISVIKLPNMWFHEQYVSRPYELISFFIYLILIVFFCRAIYQQYQTILADCIFYMALTHITISIYLMMFSNTPYDSAYNIAYFLKIVAYFIPCVCLIISYVHSYREVLEAQKRLKIKQEELAYLASHDSLTNLFNRREFEELLDKSIANAARDNSSFALLLIDLDNFKSINDSLGHFHGDELLKQFAQRLVTLVRKGDLVSRIGGDEFTLISPNFKAVSSIRQLSERILNELNNPYMINNKLITVTMSIGIAIYPDDDINTEDLLRKADLAMYKSKNCGKNTYEFYTNELNVLQHRESEVQSHLRQALHNDEFELYYQPKYDLMAQQLVGAEILLRWNNPTLGSIHPEEFIPIAENSGLIIDLGHWVIRKACQQIMKWSNDYHKFFSFSINISPVQLAQHHFIPNLKNILNEYSYPTEHLEFEITENSLIDNSEHITQVLNELSIMGIKLALDDFGKGYSSLNRLKSLPIDTLKIDKEFISDIQNDNKKVIIVDIIIKLAIELGMSIVAEGIETEQQLNYLRSKKCCIGQGFLLSKPISAEEFVLLAYNQPQKEFIF